MMQQYHPVPGIHHPSGDIKKISYSDTPFTSDTWSGTPANSHWKVNWSDGVQNPVLPDPYV